MKWVPVLNNKMSDYFVKFLLKVFSKRFLVKVFSKRYKTKMRNTHSRIFNSLFQRLRLWLKLSLGLGLVLELGFDFGWMWVKIIQKVDENVW